MGCGNQEIFRSCADITIVEGDGLLDDESNEGVDDEGNDVEEEEETADEEDSQGLQPCLLHPLNTHDPRSRINNNEM